MTSPDSRLPARSRLQYSLRGFFIAMTVAMIWLGLHTHAARQQAAARRAIGDQGGQSLFDYQISGSARILFPAGLRSYLGEDLFATVVRVNFPLGKPENDDCLSALADLPHVTVINTEASSISDAGLARIGTADLDCLRMINSRVTDKGLSHLRGLVRLSMLDLTGNQITDAGLQDLASLERLEYLTLRGTAVTDAGIQRLAGLQKLILLNVQDTHVTAEGAAALRRLLPNCQIVQ